MKSILEICDPAKRKGKFPPETVLLSEGKHVWSSSMFSLKDGSKCFAAIPRWQSSASQARSSVKCRSCLIRPIRLRFAPFRLSTVYAYADAAGFMRSDPQIAFVIARLLAQRLNSATTYLADLKRQYAGQGNHLGMVSDVLASLIHQQEAEFTPGSDRLPDPAM